ncbi:hypothetical protein I4U23_003782 [Adineta vaga]|nr:hypothetical protein I4U23_003782 [Adineta vaga]
MSKILHCILFSFSMNLLRLSISVIAILLFLLSVILLGFICNSLAYVNGDASQHTATFTNIYNTYDINGQINGTVTSQRTLAYLPSRVDIGSYWIIFAAALGGLLDSLLIIFFIIRRTPISITKTLVFDYFNATIAVLSLLRIGIDTASIAFSFVQFNNSNDFFFDGMTDSNNKYIGHFTLEAFNCHLKNYTTDTETFNRWCIQGRVARWLLVPHLILSTLIFILSLIASGSTREDSDNQNRHSSNENDNN